MRLGWLGLILATAVSILIMPPQGRDALGARRAPTALAAPRGIDPAGPSDLRGSGRGDRNGDNADRDNDDDRGDNDGVDDGRIDRPPSFPSIRPLQPSCSTPGRDTDFISYDGRATVRVLGSSPRPVRAQILNVLNADAAPPPSGTPVGLLVYEIRAGLCDASFLPEFPAEVSLAMRYTDAEADGLDRSRFVIGRLDLPTGHWVPVEHLANDPAANIIAATIIRTGFYMAWEER
jgi:hypothetical protein